MRFAHASVGVFEAFEKPITKTATLPEAASGSTTCCPFRFSSCRRGNCCAAAETGDATAIIPAAKSATKLSFILAVKHDFFCAGFAGARRGTQVGQVNHRCCQRECTACVQFLGFLHDTTQFTI